VPDDDYASWMDSLHAHPKLAESVGQFMATFAGTERLLWFLYGAILGNSETAARALLGHIESFSIKLTAIENYLPHSSLSLYKRRSAEEFLGTARECNTFRNSLAHGLYLSNEAGTKVELLSYATSTGRKPKQVQLTTALLGKETLKLFALRDGIRNEFFPDFGKSHRPKHIL
jgi:hypothetical protein